MSNNLEGALASLQSPQERPDDRAAKNAAIINAFNHSNAHERMTRNQARVNPPNYDALIQKLHGVDAELLSGRMADQSRFDPQLLRLAQTAQMTGKPDLAYHILNEENRRILSRDAIGGSPLSTMAWEKLRHNAGVQALQRHGGEDEQGELGQAMGAPTAKDDLYRLGVESFDKQFGKHKHYLVHDDLSPNRPTPQTQQPIAPPMSQQGSGASAGSALPPGIESVVHNAAVIGQQQQQGAPAMAPDQFAQKLGAES